MSDSPEHVPSLLIMYLTTSSYKSATSDATVCLVFNSRLSWHVLYFLVVLLMIFFTRCYKCFSQASLPICGFQQICWVTKVNVILWLLGLRFETSGIILQDSDCQSVFSVQCRAMKKMAFFNHEITWSQEGGALSHCVVINKETTRFSIQAAEEIFRAVISFPND